MFCLKLLHACDQWYSSRESTALTVASINYVQTLKVVGHTIQEGGITNACDQKVFRVDVGLSKGCGDGGSLSSLEAGLALERYNGGARGLLIHCAPASNDGGARVLLIYCAPASNDEGARVLLIHCASASTHLGVAANRNCLLITNIRSARRPSPTHRPVGGVADLG
jgi:hypothetical protein